MFALRMFIVLAGTKVISAWTVDLPEVRQHYFEKYGHGAKVDIKTDLKENEIIYNNYYSNSEFHKNDNVSDYSPPVEYSSYGHDDKNDKVHEENAGAGRKYADKYEYQTYMEKKVHQLVQNGSRYLDGLSRAIERFSIQLQNCSTMTYTDLLATGQWESCKKATNKSEHVRRLAQMALHTTRQLQETAERSAEDDSYEETALVLRLAWFLDQLTNLTGFEPDTQDVTPTPTSTIAAPTAPPPVTGFLGLTVPDEVRRQLLDCLQQSSNQTGVERCRYPRPLPPAYAAFFNITDEPPARSIQKRSVTENPAINLIKYYAKYKAWTNANPEESLTQDATMTQDATVTHVRLTQDGDDNHLRRKRQAEISEGLVQDISVVLKHRAEPYLKPDREQSDRIRQYIASLQNNRNKPQTKSNRVQRSIYRYRADTPASTPENPHQDISYYVRSKPGTDVVPNPRQAAQVRRGLQEIFQNGNIEVVHRYGSNYVPLNREHVLVGLLRFAAGI